MPGVYISWPFCSQKCTYCNFTSGVARAETVAEYTHALESEIRGYRFDWVPETVYIGGGTPSNIAPSDFGKVLDPLPGRPWREATIEAAPGTFDAAKADAWIAAVALALSLPLVTHNPNDYAGVTGLQIISEANP